MNLSMPDVMDDNDEMISNLPMNDHDLNKRCNLAYLSKGGMYLFSKAHDRGHREFGYNSSTQLGYRGDTAIS